MDQIQETTELERRVTWEVIPLDKLLVIVANTLEETVFQNVAAANSSAQLLELIPPQQEKRRKDRVTDIIQATADAVKQLRTIKSLLRQDPSTPIPIDHRYEHSDHLIIALDQVGNPPAPQNPISEGK